MDPKNRLVIVPAVAILILGAIFISFGRSIFTLRLPSVELPSDGTSSSASSGVSLNGQNYQRVDITPETVQNVVATLERLESFYREITVETFWNNQSSVTQVQNWTDNGWSLSYQALPSGLARYELVGDGMLYYWYEGNSRYLSISADQFSTDLSQHIPTYETVLELAPNTIMDAGYELCNDQPCIYTVVQNQELGLLTRFWISVDSGLLISAEQEQNGHLVYRMSSYGPAQSPCPASAAFSLPDGTVLHTVD